MLHRFIFVLLLGVTFSPAIISASPETDTPREIMRLGRGAAYQMDWHPSGEILAVASATGLWLHNRQFEPVAQFNADTPVFNAAWSPDGNWLAVGSNRFSQLWRYNGGTLTLETTQTHLSDYAYSYVKPRWHPNSRYVLFEQWMNVETGEMFDTHSIDHMVFGDKDGDGDYEEYAYDTRPVSAAWWSSDGQRFVGRSAAMGCSCGKFAIFDVTGEKLIDLEGTPEGGSQFEWSSDGTLVTNGGEWWDADTGVSLFEMYGVGGVSYQYLWDEPGGIIVNMVEPLGIVETHLTVWDVSTQKLMHDYEFRNNFNDIDWLPGSTQHITALTEAGDILVIDIHTGRVEEQHRLFSRVWGSDLAWSPDSKWLAVSSIGPYEPPVEIWQIKGGETRQFEPYTVINDNRYPNGYEPSKVEYWSGADIRWTDDGQNIVFNTNFYGILRDWQRVVVRDAFTGDLQRTVYSRQDMTPVSGSFLSFVIYSPDLTVRTEFFWDTPATIYDDDSGEVLWRVESNYINDISFSPDSHYMLTVGDDPDDDLLPQGKVWDVKSHIHIATLPQPGYTDAYIAWSADSRRIATASGIYNPANGKKLAELESLSAYLQVSNSFAGIAWSPDGNMIARISGYGIMISDARTGATIEHIKAFNTQKLAWSPDGTMLAIKTGDGLIRILDVADLMA